MEIRKTRNDPIKRTIEKKTNNEGSEKESTLRKASNSVGHKSVTYFFRFSIRSIILDVQIRFSTGIFSAR